MNRSGYTLTEAIIASFLLIAAILVSARLFHASLRYSVWSENKAVATYLAEKRLAEFRRWAETQTNWSGPPTGNDPAHSAFIVNALLENHTIASPSTQLEFGLVPQRNFQPSLRKVIVNVSWNSGANTVSLTSLLRDPRRGWRPVQPIVVSGPIPGALGPTEDVLFTATGFSPSAAIADLCFTWSVEPEFPGGALGGLTPSRDGRSATFTNSLTNSVGAYPSGRCRVYATAIYGGEEARGSSAVLTLTP